MSVEPGVMLPRMKIVDGELIISITADELAFVAEGKHGGEYKIVDKNMFLLHFKQQLENYAESNAKELGISELQYFFDEVIDETYSDGSDAIISTNES